MAIWSAEIKELERLYESLKGQLPDLEKELERLVKADDGNMILLYSRRCLEVIITDLLLLRTIIHQGIKNQVNGKPC
jgi:hypothetical protein